MTTTLGPRDTDAGVPDGVIRPPWTSQKTSFLVFAVVGGILLLVAMQQTGVSPRALVDGAGRVGQLVDRMLPPSFVELRRYLEALATTIFMVVAGTALAVVLSIPLAVLAARNTTTGRVAYAVSRGIIVFTRAVPDLVFALILVRAIGLGPLAGVLAMGLHSIGMIGKLYSDAIEQVDPGPVRAITSVGGSRLQVLTSGVLSQVLPSWIAVALFRLDINVRISVILGYVGAGGIGFELRRVQGQLVYPRVLAIMVLIFVLIVAMEQVSQAARRALVGEVAGRSRGLLRHGGLRDPRTALALLPSATPGRATGPEAGAEASPGAEDRPEVEARRRAAREAGRARPIRAPWTRERRRRWVLGIAALVLIVVSFGYVDATPQRLGRLAAVWPIVVGMLPPDFVTGAGMVAAKVLETLWIAIAATGIGLVLSLPFAILGARNATPSPVAYRLARLGMLFNRGIPELIVAVLLVAALGLGPFPGVLALSIGAIGFTGKLMADAIEDQQDRGMLGLQAVGANWWQRTASGVLPPSVPAIVGIALYTLDVNIRAATILGIVGAGGIGGILSGTIATLQYQRMLAIICVIFVIVYGFERLAGWLRRQLI